MKVSNDPACSDCKLRPERLFCDMPFDALQAFESIRSIRSVSSGDVLFVEGEASRGVYVLCDGRAKLSVNSAKGKHVLVRVAHPGEIVGLGATMIGARSLVTAEVLDDSRVAYIKRGPLMKFLREHREVSLMVVGILSEDLHGVYERLRDIGTTALRRHS